MDISETDSRLVSVARFLDPVEAQMARSALEAEGIEAFLQGENANSLVPMVFRTRLLVGQQDEAAAREILESAEATDADGDGAL